MRNFVKFLMWGFFRLRLTNAETETGTELHTIQGHTGGITGVAFSQNGKTVASASKDGTILFWDWDKITAIR